MNNRTRMMAGLAALLIGGTGAMAQGSAEAPPRRQRRVAAEELTEEQREQIRVFREEVRAARAAGAGDEEIQELRVRQRARMAAQREARQEGATEEQRREWREQRVQRRRDMEANLTEEQREMARERMEQRRRAREAEERTPDAPRPPRMRPEGGGPAPWAEAGREAMREALQARGPWVMEQYDKDGDGVLSEEERAAFRRDFQEHMQRFFK